MEIYIIIASGMNNTVSPVSGMKDTDMSISRVT